jgi:hypothetical protein
MLYKIIGSCLFLMSVISGCANVKQEQSSDIERGRNIIEKMGCNDCHTPDYDILTSVAEEDWLVGGRLGFRSPSGTQYPANLRLLLNSMSEEDWVALARQMRKDSPMESVLLPKASEQDLRSIYRFVQFLGPKGVPAPSPLPAGVIPETRYVDFPYLH